MKIMASLMINRPMEQVFTFVVDMENLPHWARGVVDAWRTTSGPEGIGTTYRIAGRFLGREIASTYELTAYERPTTFAATGAIGPIPLREVYTFTTTPRGTQVHVVSEMEPRGVVRLLRPILSPLLARLIETDLRRLKRRLEDDA